jgi:hypothetical protein
MPHVTPFSVYVEFADQQADLDTYDRLLQALPKPFRPAVGPAENGNVSVRLLINADSVAHAFTLGAKAAQDAGISAGITPDTLIHAEVMTEAEFDRRQDQLPAPVVPPLAGLHEAASILGVSADGIVALMPELETHLIQELESGPVYYASGAVEVANRHPLSPVDASSLCPPLSSSDPDSSRNCDIHARRSRRPNGRLPSASDERA